MLFRSNELAAYDDRLINKPSVVVANKMDLENAKENLKLFKDKYPNIKVFEISAILNEGLKELMTYLYTLVKETDETSLYEDESINHKTYNFEEEIKFTINKEDNIWVVKGKDPEDLVLMTRFTEDESVLRFGRKIKGMGIGDELERLGAKPGDEVKILDFIFIFREEHY